ncbi:MAG: ribonuclease D [Rhodospirillales bacterium]|nr:MAG: ribonuclease D [Rhodospirillales bacterium]
MTLITDNQALVDFCRRVAGTPAVTVDTEFMRERTFWPKLCLVQVAGLKEAAAIDPLAGLDLSPLFEILADPATVKVFHAARQDLEIFYQLMGKLPAPVFDTQVAAMVCGFGDQVGYETLVAKFAKVRLDKGSRFTDWSLRPLSRRQIDYALSDVIHLRKVYERLSAKLEASGREPWLLEEMAVLTDPATYALDPELAWKRLKTRGGNGRFLAELKELAAWREREAQARDVPRNRILRDEALVEIAHHTPTTAEALARTRGLPRSFAESAAGAAVLAAVTRGLAVPEAELPEPEAKREVPRRVAATAELLKVLLKMRADEHDVAQRLVASAADVEAIAAFGEEAKVQALTGWRRQVFGDAALAVREGRLALALKAGRLTLVEIA